jgi:uncharacterized protein YeaO (DUF488 family)
MDADDAHEEEISLAGTDPEFRRLLGMHDVPAFARRGTDLQYALAQLDARCLLERKRMLEMVHLRLRQWARSASGPEAAAETFVRPIDGLWPAADAQAPEWADRTAPSRRLRALARELAVSVVRFNRRWGEYLEGVNYERINRLVERYNRYYVLEKECVLGSARLAARLFVPTPEVDRDALLAKFPMLEVPEPRR